MFHGNQSYFSSFSSDEEENDEIEDAVRNNVFNNEPTDAAESDDDIPLASLAGASNQASSNDQGRANNKPVQRVYRLRKRDTIVCDHSFLKQFSEPSLEDVTPLQYFSMFITTALLDIVVEQTDIYSFETIHKSINTGRAKMMSLIGISMKMGILKLPSYKSY